MKKRILLFLTIIIVFFIFSRSSMSAVASTVESDSAYGTLDGILSFLNIPNLFDTGTIRKAAHFIEFAVFGFFLSSTVFAYCKKFKGEIFKILFFILAVPVTDEFIQYFPAGRSAQVSDVLLDFCGGLFGFLCLFLLIFVVSKFKKKKES